MKNLKNTITSWLNSMLPGGKFTSVPSLLTRIFYSGHCKALAPEYAKAAKRLRAMDPPLYIAKLDADSNKAIGGRYGVRGYPTLKFFK